MNFRKPTSWIIDVGVCALLVTLYLFYRDGYLNVDGQISPATLSYFGGFIGGIVAPLSFIFIYLTYQEQQKRSYKQQFETTFFNLVNLLNDLTTRMEQDVNFIKSKRFHDPSGKKGGTVGDKTLKFKNVKGKTFLSKVLFHFQTEYHNSLLWKEDSDKDDAESIKLAIQAYETIFSEYPSQLGHYFRHIYNILKLVDRSDLNKSDKDFYSGLIQTQLGSDELGLTFYNSLSIYGKNKNQESKFHELLERYSVLENVSESSIIKAEHYTSYPLTVFKFLSADKRKSVLQKRKNEL
jgi:hypothetical protein